LPAQRSCRSSSARLAGGKHDDAETIRLAETVCGRPCTEARRTWRRVRAVLTAAADLPAAGSSESTADGRTGSDPAMSSVVVLDDSDPSVLDGAIERVRRSGASALVAERRRESATVVLAGGAELDLVVARPQPRRLHAPSAWVLTAVVARRAETPDGEVERALRAVRRAPLTDAELRALRAQMPLTTGLGARLGPRALASVAPLVVVHHLLDFVVMVEALVSLGVPPELLTVLDKGYSYRHTERVDEHLKSLGASVWPWQAARAALADHYCRAQAAGRSMVLVDDGGYALPILLDEAPELAASCVGVVEQTRSGINRLRRFDGLLPVPVFSVAESRLKATVESYGIADAAVRNIVGLLPDEKWEGQGAVVVGYGRIGDQIAGVLADRRMRVAIHDRDPIALVGAHERGYLTSRSLSGLIAAHRPMLIVGTSGQASLRGEHLAATRRDVYVVSVTSRQREVAVDELADLAVAQDDLGPVGVRYHLGGDRAVTCLADGFPVNFHLAESLPNRYSDLVLAAMVIGTVTLAAPGHGFAPGHNVDRTNDVLAASGLAERYYELYGPEAP
jgi:adenosylhomocysteinase